MSEENTIPDELRSMNRTERRIYKYQLRLIDRYLPRFIKFHRQVFGRDMAYEPIHPRKIRMSRRFDRTIARVTNYEIQMSKRSYKQMNGSMKTLKEVLLHELIHAFFMDNHLPHGHTPTFKRFTWKFNKRDYLYLPMNNKR